MIEEDDGRAGLLADPEEVRAILVGSARAGEPITYSEVLNLLGHHFSRPKMRALCKVLTYVDDEAQARGEVAPGRRRCARCWSRTTRPWLLRRARSKC